MENMPNYDTIRAFRLKSARERKGLTAQEMAAKLEIPNSTYYGYENGSGKIKIELLPIIADMLDTTTDYLLGRAFDETKPNAEMPIDATVGQRIARARKLCGMTQKELALKINTSSSSVSGYETGWQEPSDDTLKAIADACGCKLSYLKGEKESSTPTEAEAEPVRRELTGAQMYDFLVEHGFVKDGYDLTLADARYLRSVVVQMREWFSDSL